MGNSASALPYSIDKQVGAPADHHGWAVHDGKSQANGESVTVFVGKKPALSKTPIGGPGGTHKHLMQLEPAYHHYQQCRKLRHPHILKVYATLDTDNPNAATNEGGPAAASSSSSAQSKESNATTGDLIVVTEPCVPLESWLKPLPPRMEELAWGLECIVRGIHFLHTANLSHGDLSPSSFYVTPSGDVKIWNFSCVTPIGGGTEPTPYFKEYEAALTPPSFRSPDRMERRWDALAHAGVHAMDSYGLAILIDHMFQGSGGIPAPLQKAVQRLQTTNIKMRPRLQPLLKCPVFDTPYQKLQLQLQEITIQPVEQKIVTWQQIGAQLQQNAGRATSSTEGLAVHKIWPLTTHSIQTICGSEGMLSQDLYRREVLAILQSFFFIAENYMQKEQLSAELPKLISLLFVVKDRSVRGSLLAKVSFLVQHLDQKALNSFVFEPMCSGFSDSSPALREMTLKATLDLVPQLLPSSTEKLSRYLVRLQSDSETSIRTNTVIFVGKLAPYLNESSVNNLLVPVYLRAMKDPFAPCRMTALQSALQTKSFFSMPDVAMRLLPSVMPLLLDITPEVRAQAFTMVDSLLIDLRKESQRMTTAAQEEERKRRMAQSSDGTAPVSAPVPTPVVANAPASGGYLSGRLSSWMATSVKQDDVAATGASTAMAAAPATAPVVVPTPVMPATMVTQASAMPMSNGHVAPVQNQFSNFGITSPSLAAPVADDDSWGEDGDDDDDGWGDDDDVANETDPAPAMDDPFASIGIKPAMTARRPIGARKLAIPAKKSTTSLRIPAAAPATKLKLDSKEMDDGWDDF